MSTRFGLSYNQCFQFAHASSVANDKKKSECLCTCACCCGSERSELHNNPMCIRFLLDCDRNTDF